MRTFTDLSRVCAPSYAGTLGAMVAYGCKLVEELDGIRLTQSPFDVTYNDVNVQQYTLK